MIKSKDYQEGYNDCKKEFFDFMQKSSFIVNSDSLDFINGFNEGTEAMKNSIQVYFDPSIEPIDLDI